MLVAVLVLSAGAGLSLVVFLSEALYNWLFGNKEEEHEEEDSLEGPFAKAGCETHR